MIYDKKTLKIQKTMRVVGYSPFIIKPIGGFKCPYINFGQCYHLILPALVGAGGVPDNFYNFVERRGDPTAPLMNWRVHWHCRNIKFYWPFDNRCPIENGKDVHIIFLKYRTIFNCLIRLMVLKKRGQTRIRTRKSLKVSNLFRGVGHSNLNRHIISFI